MSLRVDFLLIDRGLARLGHVDLFGMVPWLQGSRMPAMLVQIVPHSVKPKGKPPALDVAGVHSTTDDLKLPHEPLEFDSAEIQALPSSSSGAVNATPGCKKRKRLNQKKEVLVRAFLEKHGFADLQSPRKSSRCRLARLLWGKEEKFYPIHEAAQQGDFLMLLLCLRQGVDPFQRTSLGRTPLELALAANVDSSHNEVIFALTEPPETLSVHGFLRTKGCWSDS